MVGYAFSDYCSTQKPAWLEALMHREKFFTGCLIHEDAKKNEKNILCLDCCKSICPHCLPAHRTHRLLQVRRYVYHDVVRLEDLEKLIDCSNVQAYTINSAKVVFLNQRPQSRPFKGSGNTCTTCERSLQEPYFHCSIGCKVDYLLRQRLDLSQFLHECKSLPLSDFAFTHCIEGLKSDAAGVVEDGQMTPSSVLECGDSFGTSFGSPTAGHGAFVGCRNTGYTATTGFQNNRAPTGYISYNPNRRPCSAETSAASTQTAVMSMSRRKGTPHRSPLF